MNATKYTLLILIATLIGVFVLPWWITPILVLAISYFFLDSATKAALITFSTTALVWVVISIIKDQSSLGKVSEITGQILKGISPILLYIITGLSIALVSSLMATAGVQLRSLLQTNN